MAPRAIRRRITVPLAAAALAATVSAALAVPPTAPVVDPVPPLHRGTSVRVTWQASTFDPTATDPVYSVVALRASDFGVAAQEVLPGDRTSASLALPDGHEYLIVVTAVNDLGPPVGETASAAEVVTRVDATAPTAAITLDGGAAYTRSRDVTVDVAAQDRPPAPGLLASGLAGGHLTVIEGDSPVCPPGPACVGPFAPRRELTLAEGPDGPRRVRVYVNDASRSSTLPFPHGNPSAPAEATIVLDRAAPAARLSAAALRAAPGVPVTLDAGPSGDGTGGPGDSGVDPAAVTWDFGDGTGGTGLAPAHAYARPGTYAGQVRVADRAGNVSAPEPFTVVVAADAGAPGGGQAESARPAGRAGRPRLGRLILQRRYVAGRPGLVRVRLSGAGRVRLERAIARRTRAGRAGRVVSRARVVARDGLVTLRFRAPARAGRYVLRVRAGSATARATITVRRAPLFRHPSHGV